MKKLNKDEVSGVEEFIQLVDLVWHNCCKYNPATNGFHQLAQKLMVHISLSIYRG